MRALVWAALAPAALVFAQDPPPLVLENQPAPPAMHKGAHAKASKSGALARRIRESHRQMASLFAISRDF